MINYDVTSRDIAIIPDARPTAYIVITPGTFSDRLF